MAVVGIDLGTTNTVIAAVRDGRATALKDKLGRALLPSVVSFSPTGKAKVGYEAKDRRTIDPENTVFSVKRLIGRTFDSEHVQKAITRLPFDLKEGPGKSTLVSTYGNDHTLPEISAMVLEQAAQIGKARLGSDVSDAVITVPANFNDLQRAATKVAGRTAGLEVLRIINEPTAAALAYGFGKNAKERIAVYDFGGGTFDVTLLDLSDNVFEVLATSGDTFLGGDDIDRAIMDRMAEELLKKNKVDASSDNLVREQLRAAAEKLKIDLSTRSMGKAKIEELEFEFTLRRSEFEKLAEPLLARTLEVCQEAMNIAGISNRDLDQVLLVGGSTRIPLVRRRISSFFGKMPQSRINPDEVVAIGAAIQASSLEAKQEAGASIPAAPRPRAAGRSQHPSRAPAPLGRPKGSTQTGLAGLKKTLAGTGGSEAPGPRRKSATLTGLKSVPPKDPNQKFGPAKTLSGVGGVGPSERPSPAVPKLGEARGMHKTLAGVGADDSPQPKRGKLQTLSGVGEESGQKKSKTLAGLSGRKKGTTNLGLGASPSSPPPVTGEPPPSVREDEPSFDDETSVNEGAALVAAELEARKGREKQETLPGAAAPPDSQPEGTTDGSVTFDLAELEAMAEFDDEDEATAVLDATQVAVRAAQLDSQTDNDLPAPVSQEPEELGGSALIEFEEVGLPAPAQNADLPSPVVDADLPAPVSLEAEELGGSALIDLSAEDAAMEADLPVPAPDLPAPVADLPMGKTQVGLPSPVQAGLPSPAQAGLPSPAADLPDNAAALPSTGGLLPDIQEADLPLVGTPPADNPRRTASAEMRLGLGQTQVAGANPDFANAPDNAPSVDDLDELSVTAVLPDDEGGELDLGGMNLDALGATAALGSRGPAIADNNATQSSGTQDGIAGAMAATMVGQGLPGGFGGAPLTDEGGLEEISGVIEDSVVDALSQANAQPARPAAPANPKGPLLLDVTPLSLGVEVIGGYADKLIERNSPIPCEMTRTFATARDNQAMVRVRVMQGEEERFDQNTLLGEVELTGLSQGPRGAVKVDVSFSLDESGMLQVSARDKATGNAADARLMLVGITPGA